MSSEQGRRVVWSVLEKGRVFPLSHRWTLWQWHLMRGNAIGAGTVSARYGALS